MITCVCGLVGTCTTRISVLKTFWILMISLVIADVAMISPMAGWMSNVHKDFPKELAEIVDLILIHIIHNSAADQLLSMEGD